MESRWCLQGDFGWSLWIMSMLPFSMYHFVQVCWRQGGATTCLSPRTSSNWYSALPSPLCCFCISAATFQLYMICLVLFKFARVSFQVPLLVPLVLTPARLQPRTSCSDRMPLCPASLLTHRPWESLWTIPYLLHSLTFCLTARLLHSVMFCINVYFMLLNCHIQLMFCALTNINI